MSTQTSPHLKAANRDGVNLRYLETGSGDPPLVYIHGWCCNHAMWSEQIEAFAPRHRIITVDLRGHGESDKPDQDYDIAGFADDMGWLIKEIGLDRPVLIGHSMGGVTALKLSANTRISRGPRCSSMRGSCPFLKRFVRLSPRRSRR